MRSQFLHFTWAFSKPVREAVISAQAYQLRQAVSNPAVILAGGKDTDCIYYLPYPPCATEGTMWVRINESHAFWVIHIYCQSSHSMRILGYGGGSQCVTLIHTNQWTTFHYHQGAVCMIPANACGNCYPLVCPTDVSLRCSGVAGPVSTARTSRVQCVPGSTREGLAIRFFDYTWCLTTIAVSIVRHRRIN